MNRERLEELRRYAEGGVGRVLMERDELLWLIRMIVPMAHPETCACELCWESRQRPS